jgi:tripartite-type tricarboxylate transporter receptor subunit TctC
MAKQYSYWWLAVLSVFVIFGSAYASTHDFYKGKSIRFITAFSPGGAFDVYTRAVARHYHKHVPGKPSTIVENMTGAGGIIQANYMFQRAKPDGLTIGNNIGGLILQQILGAKGVEFDGRKFEYIGAPSVDDSVCALTKASGVTNMSEWFAAKEPLKLGGIGPGGTLSDVARTLNAALGLPIRVIDGYKGVADARLAADAGELAGYCGGWESVKLQWRKAVEAGQVSVVVQVTTKKNPELPNVPLAIDFAKTEEARRLLKYAVHDVAIMQRLFFVPPETPKDRIRLLRKSFLDTLRDPEYIADSNKTGLTIGPVTGEQIEEIVSGLFKLDNAMVAKLKSVLLP